MSSTQKMQWWGVTLTLLVTVPVLAVALLGWVGILIALLSILAAVARFSRRG